jgi:hypothetical protein
MTTKIELTLESDDDAFTTAEGVISFFKQLCVRINYGKLWDAEMLAKLCPPHAYEKKSWVDANGNTPEKFLLRVTFGVQSPDEVADAVDAADKAKQEEELCHGDS